MRSRISKYSVPVGMVAACLGFAVTGTPAQEIAPAPVDAVAPTIEGAEVMTRGVVHEAFAEVVTEPKPGLIVPKRPPEAIEEVPPEFKPDDETAIWIDGYWAWDDERDDFFWVSGVWRVPPPGMRWVAGYWNEIPGGWQWTSGFWVPVETKEIRYYDAPPASLEVGPSSPSPGDDYFWVPGAWNYYDTGYRWGPGYWAPYRADWVWIPARYFWTPAGCVYRPGYWDYRLTRRGCLFAPVYFSQPVYAQPNFVYRPWCALNTTNLFVHLWVRPNYCHFYFGNYYGSNYGSWGFTPWCHYRPYRGCYDPMLTQLQCHYRHQGVNYVNRLDGWHQHFAANAGARPPRTWNEQVKIVHNTTIVNNKTHITNVNVQQNVLAVNVNDRARQKDLPIKLAHLDGNAQKHAVNVAHEAREVRKHRIDIERPAGIDLAKGAVTSPSPPSPTRERGDDPTNPKRKRGDVTLTNPATKVGDDANAPRERGNPKRDHVKLELPATQVDHVAKERVKLAPPKLSETKLEPPMNSGKPRLEAAGPPARIEPGTGKGLPQPKLENPTSPVKDRSPRSEPKIKTPHPEPKIDSPQRKQNIPPQPKLDTPQPKIETPRPDRSAPRLPTRNETPILPRSDLPRNNPQPKLETPQPKIERSGPRIETPQPKFERPAVIERPQPKVDTPRPAAHFDPAPRLQSAPQPRFTPAPPAPTREVAPRRNDAPNGDNGSGGNGRGNRKK